MIDEIVALKIDVEMLKSVFGNSVKVGPVEEINAEKGYRIKLGDGPDGPYLSPWYPHPESGGQSSSWMPLSKGQKVGVITAAGDPRQGVLLRGGFAGDNAAPSSDLAANVLEAFGIKITMKDGTVSLEGDLEVTGDVQVTGDVDFAGGHVQHNGASIDDSHVHGGVTPGGSNTDVPAN